MSRPNQSARAKLDEVNQAKSDQADFPEHANFYEAMPATATPIWLDEPEADEPDQPERLVDDPKRFALLTLGLVAVVLVLLGLLFYEGIVIFSQGMGTVS